MNFEQTVLAGVLVGLILILIRGIIDWFKKPRSIKQVWKYYVAMYKTRHNPDETVEWKKHFGGHFRQKTKPKPSIHFIDV